MPPLFNQNYKYQVQGLDGAALNSQSLTPPTANYQLPQEGLKTPQPQDYAAAVGSIPTTADLFAQAYGGQTQTDQNQNTLSQRILNLTSSLGGKAQAQATAEANVGLPNLNKSLTDVNGQIQALQKEALAIPLQVTNDFTGRASTQQQNNISNQKLRENTIKSLGLSAIAQTLQGNITLAQQQANKAVDLEYSPKQAELDYLKQAYSMNKDQLTREDSKRSKFFEAQLADRQTQLDQQKEDKKTIVALAGAAVKNFPNDPQAQYAAQQALQAGDLQTAFSLVGKYQQNPQDIQNAILDQQYKRAQIAKLNKETAALGVPGISNPTAAPYAGALSTIIGSGKFTKDQAASISRAINSGEDPFTVVKNQAKALLGQAGETQLTKYETARSAMVDLQNAVQAFYNAGGSTDIFKGNYEKVANRLGTVNDPRLVDLATQIETQLQVYRNAVSGTAYSEQEGRDIRSIFPGIDKGELLNNTVIKARLAAFDSTIDGTYTTALGNSYTKLKALNQAQQQTQQGFSDPSKMSSTSQSNPAVGMTTTINGHTYKSDGTQWVLVQ